MRTFNIAPNQIVTISELNGFRYESFTSYGQHVATSKNGVITLNGDWWDYSKTTRKWFCKWSGYADKKAVLNAIKDGLIVY